MKLQSKTSYMFVTTPSKSDNIPHTNMIQDSFKIEAKVMETSESMAWDCVGTPTTPLDFIQNQRGPHENFVNTWLLID